MKSGLHDSILGDLLKRKAGTVLSNAPCDGIIYGVSRLFDPEAKVRGSWKSFRKREAILPSSLLFHAAVGAWYAHIRRGSRIVVQKQFGHEADNFHPDLARFGCAFCDWLGGEYSRSWAWS
jgi:hypothetical protein